MAVSRSANLAAGGVTSRARSSPVAHTFVTAQPHAHVRFRIAVERRALWAAEDAARELPNLPLEDAL